MISSLYLRLIGYALAVILIASAGAYLNGLRWQGRYEALQATDAQALANGEGAARKALQDQIQQAQDTSANNEKVLRELQTKTDQALADRDTTGDLVRRLLAQAARAPTAGHPLPQAPGEPGTAPAVQASGDGYLGALLTDAALECRGNERQLNALREQVIPQL